MSVEFIGFVGNHAGSESIKATGPVVDLDYIHTLAKTQEHAGFDRVLLAFHSTSPESLMVGQYVASVTERLGLMIAHRPGFVAPTVAARQLATLDHISRGRAAVHIITGGNDQELAQDGDHLSKDERYGRTDEYLEILRQEWTASAPFDHAGRHYQVKGAFSAIKPYRPEGIPVYFGGASDKAIEVAGKHADIYALWGETLAQVNELLGRVRQSAALHGRKPRFSLSLRPVLAETEEAAWAKADRILEQAKALVGETPDANGYAPRGRAPENSGSLRLLEAAAKGDRHDKRLWTAIAKLTGAKGNSTGLVGTPDQVAEAMMDYYDLGVTTFLIRGFDPIADAVEYGRDLIPRVRALVAERERTRASAA